jgi:biotin transport system ATP-binding protein/energy-coupling factor transport system ATP-binding protein
MEPRYVVLDEPTSSLDPASRTRVLAMVRGLKEGGITIIHVTHHMEEVARADRVIVMDKGRIAADGTPSAIFGRVEWLKSLGLAPPPVAEMVWLLRQRGVDIGSSVFTLEEAVEAISVLGGRCCPSEAPREEGA